MAYSKLNYTNISISNAKKIEFKLNLLFYNIHLQHDKQKTLVYEDDIIAPYVYLMLLQVK